MPFVFEQAKVWFGGMIRAQHSTDPTKVKQIKLDYILITAVAYFNEIAVGFGYNNPTKSSKKNQSICLIQCLYIACLTTQHLNNCYRLR